METNSRIIKLKIGSKVDNVEEKPILPRISDTDLTDNELEDNICIKKYSAIIIFCMQILYSSSSSVRPISTQCCNNAGR